MNKKGFTLIELIVSIVLVTVILVSLLATLVKLKQTYEDVIPKQQYIDDIEYLESVILELRTQCEQECSKCD